MVYRGRESETQSFMTYLEEVVQVVLSVVLTMVLTVVLNGGLRQRKWRKRCPRRWSKEPQTMLAVVLAGDQSGSARGFGSARGGGTRSWWSRQRWRGVLGFAEKRSKKKERVFSQNGFHEVGKCFKCGI